MADISFVIREDYRKVGFKTHDEFAVEVCGLTGIEAEKLRNAVLELVKAR